MNEIYRAIIEPEYSRGGLDALIYVLRIFGFLFSLFFIGAIVYYARKLRQRSKNALALISEQAQSQDYKQQAFDERWSSIEQKLEGESDSDYNIAIIDADNMVDAKLKQIGYVGDDMGSRLRQLTGQQVSNLEDLWQVHKLRNRIAHEPNFKITRGQAKQAIDIYKRAMEDLEGL